MLSNMALGILMSMMLIFTNNIHISFMHNIINKVSYQLHKHKIATIYDHIPMHKDHIVYLINLSYEYGIDPDLVLAIIWTESTFNPNAKNKKSSARGYGQFIQSTADSIANRIPEIKDYDHHIHGCDPYINIHLTIFYLNHCINHHDGNLIKALRSYRGRNDQKYFKLIAKRREYIKKNKEK